MQLLFKPGDRPFVLNTSGLLSRKSAKTRKKNGPVHLVSAVPSKFSETSNAYSYIGRDIERPTFDRIDVNFL